MVGWQVAEDVALVGGIGVNMLVTDERDDLGRYGFADGEPWVSCPEGAMCGADPEITGGGDFRAGTIIWPGATLGLHLF
jgi:hypothetical protein